MRSARSTIGKLSRNNMAWKNMTCSHVVLQTVVSIHQYATYHRDQYWTDSYGFHPERFLDAKGFENDERAAFQPFHLGSRGCLGRKSVPLIDISFHAIMIVELIAS